MSIEGELATQPKEGRRYRTVEEKRRIVEEALRPGASVSEVARRNGVNTNQLFSWRSLYLGGHFKPSSAKVTEARLLPVSVSDEPKQNPGACPRSTSSNITINIELPGCALVSLEGQVSVEIIRAVLESLRR